MINNTVFNIATTHAASLKASTGKSVVASKSSMLSNLVSLSFVGDLPTQTEITYADVLQATTRDSVEGPSLHTQAIANEIEKLIPMVSSHISFIQNAVCPKVAEFDEIMAQAVKRSCSGDPLVGFEVIQVSPPDPISNEDFMALVNQFADGNVSAPSTMITLPEITVGELTDAMSVSSSSVNASIKRWISERGDKWITDVWHHYFASGSASASGGEHGKTYVGSFVGIPAQPAYQRLDTALALFLIARGLLDSPLENANMDIEKWRSLMDQVSRFAGYQVQCAINLIDSNNSNEVLVLGVYDNSRRVMVNAPIYTRYLEEGGRIEDVLGAAISGQSSTYSLPTFREKGQDFNKIFSNFRAIAKNDMRARAVTMLRAEAKAAFASMLEAVNPDESEVMSACNITCESLQSQADIAIDAKVLPQLENTGHLAVELIAGIRFKHTPARQFILDMNAAEESGCTCPEEAASIAALNYISAYAASNLGLSN